MSLLIPDAKYKQNLCLSLALLWKASVKTSKCCIALKWRAAFCINHDFFRFILLVPTCPFLWQYFLSPRGSCDHHTRRKQGNNSTDNVLWTILKAMCGRKSVSNYCLFSFFCCKTFFTACLVLFSLWVVQDHMTPCTRNQNRFYCLCIIVHIYFTESWIQRLLWVWRDPEGSLSSFAIYQKVLTSDIPEVHHESFPSA